MEPLEGKIMGTPKSTTISTRLQRIAELAEQAPEMAFTSLAHHIDVEFLKEAYRCTRKDGAVGVDGVTAADYEQNVEGNLQSLLDRFKSGRYFAPPVRRVHIPKGDGKTRPIGIPTLEDKVLQRAVTMVLQAVYEQDFLPCSYGFRPGRSAHQALEALWTGLMKMGGGWVLDVDIKSFFDTLDHAHLRSFLDRRVRDGVLRRTIGKWLNAGVLEEGNVSHPDAGTPQGGVISPLLANLYLHEVLDLWFEREVRPRLTGPAFLVRYADDFVIACANERDARRLLAVLPQRFGRFGLTLHPEKTRLVRFTRPTEGPGEDIPGRDDGARTFDLLGFTHYWGRSRQGRWVVKRKTAKKRFRRAIKQISQWCRENRHLPIGEQHRVLTQKLRGHDAYYGITGNGPMLARLRHVVRRAWRAWLDRRGGKKRMNWERFAELLQRFPLPIARVVHSIYSKPCAANP
jgi:group II intron reverse transcriptase/maturase